MSLREIILFVLKIVMYVAHILSVEMVYTSENFILVTALYKDWGWFYGALV